MNTPEDLPAYLYCDQESCDLKHYLTFNRDIQGKWNAAYVEYEAYEAIPGLISEGNGSTMEAATRLQGALVRRKHNAQEPGQSDQPQTA
jgi:hypothetical protein